MVLGRIGLVWILCATFALALEPDPAEEPAAAPPAAEGTAEEDPAAERTEINLLSQPAS